MTKELEHTFGKKVAEAIAKATPEGSSVYITFEDGSQVVIGKDRTSA